MTLPGKIHQQVIKLATRKLMGAYALFRDPDYAARLGGKGELVEADYRELVTFVLGVALPIIAAHYEQQEATATSNCVDLVAGAMERAEKAEDELRDAQNELERLHTALDESRAIEDRFTPSVISDRERRMRRLAEQRDALEEALDYLASQCGWQAFHSRPGFLYVEDELTALRNLVRKLASLLPGPRGREVMLTEAEHVTLNRTLSNDS